MARLSALLGALAALVALGSAVPLRSVCRDAETRFTVNNGLGNVHGRRPAQHLAERGVALPEAFSWANVSGVSFLTEAKNQHIPQCKRGGRGSGGRTGSASGRSGEA